MTRLQSPVRVLQAALALGWSTDVLFYGKSSGISLLLFVLLLLVTLVVLSRLEGIPTMKPNLWLIAPLIFFATMVFVRANGTLTLLNISATLVILAMLIFFYAAGRVERLGLLGYPLVVLLTAKNVLGRQAPAVASVARAAAAHKGRFRLAAPLLRGLLLAVPILFVFTLLLSSADTIFADYVGEVLQLKFLSDSPEMLWRIALMLAAAWLIAGGLFYALTRSRGRGAGADADLPGVKGAAWWNLGFIEGMTIMALVNALFAVFAYVQFTNIFFGQPASMHYEDYREYVRRGFGELLIVAVLTMLLIVGLRRVIWKETAREARAFNGLSTVMIVLTGVMLVSAFQRMLVWEEVQFYIATPLRLYVRAFIVWLGLAFAWLLFTSWLRPQRFAVGAFATVLGFLITINVMNPDAFVASTNLAREDELSTRYLHILSEDAVPALVAGLDTVQDDVVRANLRDHLSLRLHQMERDLAWQSWPSYHISRWQAYDAMADLRRAGKLDQAVTQLATWTPQPLKD